MREHVQKVRQVLSLAYDNLSLQLPDTFEVAGRLVISQREEERIAGLRRLEQSRDPRAPHLVLTCYRFSSSLHERMSAENCLVRLSERFPEAAADAAIATLHTQSLWSERFVPKRSLARSSSNLERLLAISGQRRAQDPELSRLLLKWSSKLPKTSSKNQQMVLNTLANPWLRARSAENIAKKHPDDFTCANSRIHLVHALRGVYSDQADMLRLMVIRDLIPGPFADLTFETLEPHRSRSIIQSGLGELLEIWQSHYEASQPTQSSREHMLRVYRGEGTEKPPNHD